CHLLYRLSEQKPHAACPAAAAAHKSCRADIVFLQFVQKNRMPPENTPAAYSVCVKVILHCAIGIVLLRGDAVQYRLKEPFLVQRTKGAITMDTMVTLNDGNRIPAVGFGVFRIPADGPTY